MPSVVCNRCGDSFARQDNLIRHINRKNRCDSTPSVHRKDQTAERCERKRRISGDFDRSEEVTENDDGNEIPTFDGDEFSGKKPKSRDTLYRMMQMLNIPDHRWENIATDILDTDQKDFSMWIDEDEDGSGESRDEEDAPLNESEIEELCKRFKLLQYALIYKGHRENVSELLDILNVLLEAGLISRADYIKKTNKVKDL